MPLPYHSFLLRCWVEVQSEGERCWRFSLEEPRTGRRQGYASLAALISALETLTSDPTPTAEPDTDEAQPGSKPVTQKEEG